MSKAQEYREFSLCAFQFIAGVRSDRPELERLKRFIDARSRVTELREMRQYHAVVNSRYTKSELIEFFCNLQAFECKLLLEKLPEIITVLPADCKNFKIERPKAIAYRSGNFGGATVEYPVYTVLDFLNAIQAIAL